MIFGEEIHYSHTGQLNQYKVYYRGDQIGEIRHTPGTAGTWTFTDNSGKVNTFGSTRLQAIGFYIQEFMKGEREHGTTPHSNGFPKKT